MWIISLGATFLYRFSLILVPRVEVLDFGVDVLFCSVSLRERRCDNKWVTKWALNSMWSLWWELS